MTSEGILFNLYLSELIAWNKKFNLTAITDPEEIRIKHFADSLSLLQAIKLTNESVIDIGTGAGFPGIPLKIVSPDINLTLLEATKKKTEFLRHIISQLKLTNTEVIWSRAEDYAKKGRETFDLALARAVAELPTLVELALPFIKIGGRFIAYKEVDVLAEVKKTDRAIKELGAELVEIKKVTIYGNEPIDRFLVIIKKITETPSKYPRRAGLAAKRPLI